MKSTTMGNIVKKYFVLILLALFSLTLLIISLINQVELNGNNAYVIGKITDKKPYRSGSTIYYFSYSYRGIQYTGQRIDAFWHKKINYLFFLKVLLKKNYAIGDIEFIKDIPVPYCLTMVNVPFEGWKDLPVNVCK